MDFDRNTHILIDTSKQSNRRVGFGVIQYTLCGLKVFLSAVNHTTLYQELSDSHMYISLDRDVFTTKKPS